MKYQRVLYTNELTAEIRSRLRIVSYKKRRSLKNNVYFVSFASDADVKIADRSVKRLRNVTLKPVQCFSSDIQHEDQSGSSNGIHKPSSSSTPFRTPPTTLSFLRHCSSTFVASQSPVRTNETLEERARRILGPRLPSQRNDGSIPTRPSAKFVGSYDQIDLNTNYVSTNQKDKIRIMDSVQSCLKTMKLVQQAADRICELHSKIFRIQVVRHNKRVSLILEREIDCRAAMNSFFRLHSTTFYLKATACAQIKANTSAGLRLPWSDVAHLIDLVEVDVRHQQSFVTQTASAKYISSKIDSATSIAMSSKLAYQLAKLSK